MTLGRSAARSVTFAAGATSSRRRNQSNVGAKDYKLRRGAIAESYVPH
jgi:hypothetical protein